MQTLPNGLQLLAVERPNSKTFVIALAVGVGSFDDPQDFPGLAHFCEHLKFRGANEELGERITALGGYVNGHTSIDHTLYEVRGHVDYLPLAIEFVANVLRNEPRTDEEIAQERSIVRHEFSHEDKSDREISFDRYSRAALGDPNWNVTPKQSLTKLKRLTADSLDTFQRAHYRANNVRLACISPISLSELQRNLEVHLSTNVAEESSSKTATTQRPTLRKRVLVNVDAFSYLWITFTYIARNTNPVTRFAAEILADLTGSGPHSMLFRQLRTDRQLAYSVHADDLPYRHCTAIYWHTTVSRWSLKPALDVFVECEKRFTNGGITAEELESAKLRLKRSFEMYIDYPEHLAAFLAYEALRADSDALLQPDRYLQTLSNLTLEELNEVAAALLSAANRVVFVGGRVGPMGRFLIRRKVKSLDCS
jgi:predicted Zn-dependent peptidase